MKPPFWATTLTLLGISVLCALGVWQLQRLEWKNDLIAKLDQAYQTPKAKLLDLQSATSQSFAYGRVSGILMTDQALLLGPRTSNKEIGNDLVVPLRTQDGTILINMGWTQWPLEQLSIHHLNGHQVWFEGLTRIPSWNSFTPENRPEKNLWYRPDIDEIATAKNLNKPLPFILRAEKASHKYDAAFPNNERLYPNNNHLQYALFWFAMGVALAGVYILRFIVIEKKN